jgi:hypothetical protein
MHFMHDYSENQESVAYFQRNLDPGQNQRRSSEPLKLFSPYKPRGISFLM